MNCTKLDNFGLLCVKNEIYFKSKNILVCSKDFCLLLMRRSNQHLLNLILEKWLPMVFAIKVFHNLNNGWSECDV